MGATRSPPPCARSRSRPTRPPRSSPTRAWPWSQSWPSTAPRSPGAKWSSAGCRSCRPGACPACFAPSRRSWGPSGSPTWPTRPGSASAPLPNLRPLRGPPTGAADSSPRPALLRAECSPAGRRDGQPPVTVLAGGTRLRRVLLRWQAPQPSRSRTVPPGARALTLRESRRGPLAYPSPAAGTAADWPPRGSGAATPDGALRAIDATARPRRLRQRSRA
jgi:hypothetical protein